MGILSKSVPAHKFHGAGIGILGGSFDPVHNGHCVIAQAALEHFRFEKIFFIPAGILPHRSKTAVTSSTHRLAMLKLAISGNRFFSVLDIETRKKGKSYTVHTLSRLKKQYPEKDLYFIIGSDNLPEISTWRDYRNILSMVTLCVAERPGYKNQIPAELQGFRIISFPCPGWEISSSIVREQLKNGLSCRYLTGLKVLSYIKKHGLYKQ